MFKSGFVTIIGKPNVGKSTLMNVLVGEKLAIVSNKPQTTRNKITTILTTDDYQIVFLDTPGFHKSKTKLGDFMVKSIDSSLKDLDIVLHVIEPTKKVTDMDQNIIERLKQINSISFLIINKIDMVPEQIVFDVINIYKDLYNYEEIIPISAFNNKNIDIVKNTLCKHLKEGPMYYPSDMITDQPEKQIVAEIIREKILHLMQDEIPHGVAVEITSMKPRLDKPITDIDATIYCDKDSHKGMIIGKKGAMLKEIGIRSRYEIEKFLDTKINLKLWIKVKKDWRNQDFYLKNFNYTER